MDIFMEKKNHKAKGYNISVLSLYISHNSLEVQCSLHKVTELSYIAHLLNKKYVRIKY